jgi:hypothetical protein
VGGGILDAGEGCVVVVACDDGMSCDVDEYPICLIGAGGLVMVVWWWWLCCCCVGMDS